MDATRPRPLPSQPIPALKQQLRLRHLGLRTERAYVSWVRRFLKFRQRRRLPDRGPLQNGQVAAFLSYLANERGVSASTQNQALCAILFFCRHVLHQELGKLDVVRAKRKRKLPVVLSQREVQSLFQQLPKSRSRLVLALLYGTGMRLLEGLRLRVKDIDFNRELVVVRDGKGNKDRITMLPRGLIPALRKQIQTVEVQQKLALEQGYSGVELPYALGKKYPRAEHELAWQYVFPAARPSHCPRTRAFRRHHLHERSVQRAFKQALRDSGIAKAASCHTLRHSFATHLLEKGCNIRTLQELLGHRSVKTTMIYTHVLNRGAHGVISPLDDLL